jgi:hypothetical protein
MLLVATLAVCDSSQSSQRSQEHRRSYIDFSEDDKEESQSTVEAVLQTRIEAANVISNLKSKCLRLEIKATCPFCENPTTLSKCPTTGEYHM